MGSSERKTKSRKNLTKEGVFGGRQSKLFGRFFEKDFSGENFGKTFPETLWETFPETFPGQPSNPSMPLLTHTDHQNMY